MKPQVIIEFMILIILVLLFVYIIQWRDWYIKRFQKLDIQYEYISSELQDINQTLNQWELSE